VPGTQVHHALLADEAAGERRRHEGLGVRVGLRMVGIDAGQAAGELDDDVLEATAGREQRRAALADMTDGGVDRVVVAVGTA
jgi:hypothetical protein